MQYYKRITNNNVLKYNKNNWYTNPVNTDIIKIKCATWKLPHPLYVPNIEFNSFVSDDIDDMILYFIL